jgi:hypothetical protein
MNISRKIALASNGSADLIKKRLTADQISLGQLDACEALHTRDILFASARHQRHCTLLKASGLLETSYGEIEVAQISEAAHCGARCTRLLSKGKRRFACPDARVDVAKED